MVYTLKQRYAYTLDKSKGGAYMLGHKLTDDKNGKITLIAI